MSYYWDLITRDSSKIGCQHSLSFYVFTPIHKRKMSLPQSHFLPQEGRSFLSITKGSGKAPRNYIGFKRYLTLSSSKSFETWSFLFLTTPTMIPTNVLLSQPLTSSRSIYCNWRVRGQANVFLALL